MNEQVDCHLVQTKRRKILFEWDGLLAASYANWLCNVRITYTAKVAIQQMPQF